MKSFVLRQGNQPRVDIAINPLTDTLVSPGRLVKCGQKILFEVPVRKHAALEPSNSVMSQELAAGGMTKQDAPVLTGL